MAKDLDLCSFETKARKATLWNNELPGGGTRDAEVLSARTYYYRINESSKREAQSKQDGGPPSEANCAKLRLAVPRSNSLGIFSPIPAS